MEINVGMDGEVVVLDMTGDLVASTAEELKGQVSKLIEKNFNYVLLDMSKVNFMDSSGLGACIAAHKTLNENNGMFVCAKPSETVSKVFRVTRADSKLSIAPTRNDGVRLLHEKILERRKK